MRILHVAEPIVGGVPILVSHFARLQVERGNDVATLAPRGWPVTPGVEHYQWSVVRRRPDTIPVAVRELRQAVRRFEPDVIHVHSFVAGVVARTGPKLGVPLVYQPHAWAFHLHGPKVGRLVAAWERWAGRRTDMLVANCQDELDEGRAHGIRVPGRVVGVVANTAHLRPPTQAERRDAKVAVKFANQRLVLVLGRIAYQKAQDRLVSAWESEPISGARLILVGPGDSKHLRTLAPSEWDKSIHHVGETSDIRTWLWASDILAIPSRYETVSLVAAEAMSVGLPVVAMDFNGSLEAIVDGPSGAAGTVVPQEDLRKFLREVECRLSDASLRDSEGRAGRSRALNLFAGEAVCRRLDHAYTSAGVGQTGPAHR